MQLVGALLFGLVDVFLALRGDLLLHARLQVVGVGQHPRPHLLGDLVRLLELLGDCREQLLHHILDRGAVTAAVGIADIAECQWRNRHAVLGLEHRHAGANDHVGVVDLQLVDDELHRRGLARGHLVHGRLHVDLAADLLDHQPRLIDGDLADVHRVLGELPIAHADLEALHIEEVRRGKPGRRADLEVIEADLPAENGNVRRVERGRELGGCGRLRLDGALGDAIEHQHHHHDRDDDHQGNDNKCDFQ